MAYRDAQTAYVAQGASADIVITKPTGTTSGDTLIICISRDTSSDTVSAWPSGFTAFSVSPQVSTQDGQTLVGAWKVAGGSEPSTYTTTWSSSANDMKGFVAAYSGRDGTTPINAISGNAQTGAPLSPASFDAATITTTVNGCDLLWVAGSDLVGSAQTETWAMPTSPSTFTNRVNGSSTRNWFSIQLADMNQTSAGATGTVSGTSTFGGASNTTGRMTFLIALAPPGSDTLMAQACL